MICLNNLIYFFSGRFAYMKDKKTYIKEWKQTAINNNFVFKSHYSFRCYYDRYDFAGKIDSHYFIQDIVVAQKIIESGVDKHFDIGSRIDGFISHLLVSNIEVNMIDVRPLDYVIENLNFIKGNATDLSGIKSNSILSLSSLHAIEHFGLGRYGDPIDINGWYKALKEFERILAVGGKLYLSVPIGKENKLCFNAHRIFKPSLIVDSLNELKLDSFIYIKNYSLITSNDYKNYSDDDYLCGIFVFTKL